MASLGKVVHKGFPG